MKKIIAVLLIISIIAIATLIFLGIIVFFFLPTEEDAAKEFLDSVMLNDYGKAYNNYTDDNFKKCVSLEEFTKIIKNFSELNEQNPYDFNSKALRFEIGIRATIIGKDKNLLYVDFFMLNTNSGHKINSLTFTESIEGKEGSIRIIELPKL